MLITINGNTERYISPRDSPVTERATKRFNPKGGVNIPIERLVTKTTPR